MNILIIWKMENAFFVVILLINVKIAKETNKHHNWFVLNACLHFHLFKIHVRFVILLVFIAIRIK